MGLQVVETVSKGPNSVLDKDTGDMPHRTHRAPGSEPERSRQKSRIARASAGVGACVLCFLIGAVADKAVCAESKTGARAAPTKIERKMAQPNAVSGIVEATGVEQKQARKRGRENPLQASDAAQAKAAQAPHSAPE